MSIGELNAKLTYEGTDAKGSLVAKSLDLEKNADIAGSTPKSLRAVLNVSARLGSYANAIYGYTDFSSGGSMTGLGSAICAEMKMGGASMNPTGTYGVLELELVTPTGWTGVQSASLIYAQVSGDATAMTAFGTTGYLINLVGLGTASTATKVFHTTGNVSTSHGLRILIDGVAYDLQMAVSTYA